jgi:hypothetical protein
LVSSSLFLPSSLTLKRFFFPAIMIPSHYTSSYNNAFRDKTQLIAPNAGEAMHHFPGHYDPSHYQREQGYFGQRSAMAETARSKGATWNGAGSGGGSMTARGTGAGGYDRASTAPLSHEAAYNQTGYQSQQQTSSWENNFTAGANTSRAFRTHGFQTLRNQGTTLPVLPAHRTSNRDLWTAKMLPHTGVFSNYTTVAGGVGSEFHDAGYGYDRLNGTSAGGSVTTRGRTSSNSTYGYGGRDGGNGYGNTSSRGGAGAGGNGDDWRYDPNGVSMTKAVDLTRNTDPKNKYNIPGYAGYVRGLMFTHGDTFAKATRTCLDRPLDIAQDNGL